MRRTISLTAVACLLFVLALLTLTAARPATAHAAPKDGDDAAAAPATFEVYKDKGGEFRWRLRTQNAKLIASSGEGYADKRSCTAAIESVKRDAPKAPVKEMEEGQ